MFIIELDEEVHNAMISDCSVYPSEDEVILEPNTRLEVVSVYRGGNGLKVIQLKQLKPTDPIVPYVFASALTSDKVFASMLFTRVVDFSFSPPPLPVVEVSAGSDVCVCVVRV